MVGCLVAYLAARIVGCEVELVDLAPARGAVAAALGFAFAAPEAARAEADVVVHASGDPAGLTTALGLAAHEATVLEMSWYGDRTATLPLGGAFHARRLTIRSSQVGGIPAAQRARWSHRRRLSLALTLLRDPVLEVLVDGESGFEELPETLPRLFAEPSLCHRVRYSATTMKKEA